MPLYRDRIAQELEQKRREFTNTAMDTDAIEAFREACGEVLPQLSQAEIEEELEEKRLPGALPTDEYDEYDGLMVPFDESQDWESHEAVNRWARSQLEGMTTIAADGSQINPVTEFEKPVGLVQAVWIANNHTVKGEYVEDVELEVLTPGDLLFQNPNTGHIQVDNQEVPTSRFELEMQVLEQQLIANSDTEYPPVVMYDGSLILSFIQQLDGPTQKRYGEAMARLLAASEQHGVPVVGYISGSKATELATVIEQLGLVSTSRSVRDYQLLEPLIENWGDRTVLFTSRRDDTLNQLQTAYHGTEYNFSNDILFTYLNIGQGPQLDRLEFPRWILEEGLVAYVVSVIRAECGVGRGYPEILQEVDADAVLSHQDRDEFLRLYQEFSTEHGIELRWNNKALSKKRRRR